MIFACTDTSSAEVGSSSTISLRLDRRARGQSRRAASGRPTVREDSGCGNRRAIAPCRGAARRARSTSARAILRASKRNRDRLADRSARIERGAGILKNHLDGACCEPAPTAAPSNRGPRAGSRRRSVAVSPMIIRAIVDLPEPLSPASPKTSPFASEKLTSLTAFTSPSNSRQRDRRATGTPWRADDLDQRRAHGAASARCQQAARWPGTHRPVRRRTIAQRPSQGRSAARNRHPAGGAA